MSFLGFIGKDEAKPRLMLVLVKKKSAKGRISSRLARNGGRLIENSLNR
jgi:hypothetical protein